jgi:hypothetical protein
MREGEREREKQKSILAPSDFALCLSPLSLNRSLTLALRSLLCLPSIIVFNTLTILDVLMGFLFINLSLSLSRLLIVLFSASSLAARLETLKEKRDRHMNDRE